MTCSFCSQSASKQYYLCDCCLVSLESCNSAEKSLQLDQEKQPGNVIPPEENASVPAIECGSKELLHHREVCTTILVFRCCICHQDYTSKEGVWNHLGRHEVADEDKQRKYREVNVEPSVLKCVLCNDQRVYQERLYWQHVHEDHDGFFLQCSECRDCFRSQKLLKDHTLNQCNGRQTAVPSLCVGTSSAQKRRHLQINDSQPSDIDDNKFDRDCDKPSGSFAIKCPECGKECFDKTLLSYHIQDCHPPTECDICGLKFTTSNQAQYHKLNHHKHKEIEYAVVAIKEEIPVEETSLLEQVYNASHFGASTIIHCPICGAKFGNRNENHLAVHVEVIHQLSICTTCGMVFPTAEQLNDHKDQQHNALRSNRKRKNVSETIPTETLEPRSSHYVGTFFENPQPAATTSVSEPNPASIRADDDTLNSNTFDGWEIHSTVPLNSIESYVLSIEFGFRFKSQNVPSKGKMRYYDCRRIKCRIVPQCDRKLLVFIPNSDADATVSLRGKHTCTSAPPENRARAKLNEMYCEVITNLIKSGVPSKDVRKHFRKMNNAVSNNQLRNAKQSALRKW